MKPPKLSVHFRLARIDRNLSFIAQTLKLYERTLLQISEEPRNSRARRNARATLAFVESLRSQLPS